MPRRSRYVGMLDSDDEDASGQSQEHEDYITTQDAIKVVRDPSVDTRAPQLVEDAVVAKIRGLV